MTTMAIWSIGPTEIIIVAVIALLLFGRRLPEVGRSLGRGITEFKKGLKDVKDDIETDDDKKNA
jgi:sec-independent protein translocase protein TatA